MSEIVVVGALRARPGREDETRQVLSDLVEPTHREPGCILYALHQGVDDPGRFAFVERWSSRGELDDHLASPHVSAFRERAGELLAEPPDITIYGALLAGEPRKGALAAAAG
jgi:quinol monooxygenase YgiN